eukprot:3370936-Amphidinium_carterae.1
MLPEKTNKITINRFCRSAYQHLDLVPFVLKERKGTSQTFSLCLDNQQNSRATTFVKIKVTTLVHRQFRNPVQLSLAVQDRKPNALVPVRLVSYWNSVDQEHDVAG